MTRSTVILHIIFLIVNICVVRYDGAISLRSESTKHVPKTLSDEQVIKISQLSDVTHFGDTLKKIAIKRVSGTPGNTRVRNFISTSMKDLGWNVEIDSFQDFAPLFGQLTFNNVIARLNPNARRYLTLACHYDSKYFPSGTFIAATDSAVPCAMMINLASTMQKQLDAMKDKTDLSLMLIFFDGEEAFERWGPKDSIYGARNLARKWSLLPVQNGKSYLDRIDVLVLLDLLGARNPSFFSFFPKTEDWYRLMVDAETKLSSLKRSTKYNVAIDSQLPYFRLMSTSAAVEDDHVPFLRRDVPVLHIIPTPFPDVWHTDADNLSAVHLPTCENLNMIFRVFTARYLHLTI